MEGGIPDLFNWGKSYHSYYKNDPKVGGRGALASCCHKKIERCFPFLAAPAVYSNVDMDPCTKLNGYMIYCNIFYVINEGMLVVQDAQRHGDMYKHMYRIN